MAEVNGWSGFFVRKTRRAPITMDQAKQQGDAIVARAVHEAGVIKAERDQQRAVEAAWAYLDAANAKAEKILADARA